MIPLSSIPTYDPAMDLSSFLRRLLVSSLTPTKQSSVTWQWSLASQRSRSSSGLRPKGWRQGDQLVLLRRSRTHVERCSTLVFQATPKHHATRASPHSQHCVSVQSNSLRSNYIPHIPKGSVMGWKGGVIVSQPSVTQATSIKQQQPLVSNTAGKNPPCCYH